MPILNSKIQGTVRNLDGGVEEDVPQGAALLALGPRVQITISPTQDQVKFLVDSGGSVPAPVSGLAMIDTGASITCIDTDAAAGAGLAVVDSGPMSSATHPNEIVPIYAGVMLILGFPHDFHTNRAYGATLQGQGLIALIGRDVLSSAILVYNGPDDSFSLSI